MSSTVATIATASSLIRESGELANNLNSLIVGAASAFTIGKAIFGFFFPAKTACEVAA